MADFLTDGLNLIADVLPTIGGLTLQARRVVQDDMSIRTCEIAGAVIGKTFFASNATEGPRIEHGERDYLVLPDRYKLGPDGAACEPEEGDRFTSVENGQTLVFRIMPIVGEPAWRVTEGRRMMYRVHCKRVTDLYGNG